MSLTLRTQRAIQALILAGLGLFLLQKLWSGTLFWYISQRFAILTLLAAVGFLVLARVVSLPRRAKPRAVETAEPEGPHKHEAHPSPHDHSHDHAHGHDHSSLSVWALVAVALPVILGVLVPARPLGSSALANKGLNETAPLTAGNPARPARLDLAPQERTVLDWVRAFNFEADPTVFTGQPADVIGFVFHDSRLGAEQFFAGRFAVSCCVADASGIAVIVEWPDAAALNDNSWVRVQGPIQVAQLDGRALPLIVAETVEAAPEPDQPYLYP